LRGYGQLSASVRSSPPSDSRRGRHFFFRDDPLCSFPSLMLSRYKALLGQTLKPLSRPPIDCSIAGTPALQSSCGLPGFFSSSYCFSRLTVDDNLKMVLPSRRALRSALLPLSNTKLCGVMRDSLLCAAFSLQIVLDRERGPKTLIFPLYPLRGSAAMSPFFPSFLLPCSLALAWPL